MGRRIAEPPEGRRLPAYRRRRDRLGALHLHDELAVHQTQSLVHFTAGEPICFVFPVQRGYLEEITPKLVPMESEPEVLRQFAQWSRSRNEFHEKVAREPPQSGSGKWQKDYYRGVDANSRSSVPDHQTKLRLRPFTAGTGKTAPATSPSTPHRDE